MDLGLSHSLLHDMADMKFLFQWANRPEASLFILLLRIFRQISGKFTYARSLQKFIYCLPPYARSKPEMVKATMIRNIHLP